MSEQGQFQQAMRLGEELGWFVEMVPVSKNGIEYEVPSVFWDDFCALQAENAALRQDAKALAESLSEAGWTVLSWAAYAGDYFQEKHDLDGDLKAIGKIVSEHGAKYLTAQEGE